MKAIYLKLLFLLLLSGIIRFVNAQNGPAWAWAVNNNQQSTDAAGLVTDVAGNVYTASYALAKHNATGSLIWSRKLIDSVQAVYVKGLAADAAGNLYLAGYFYGTIQLDTATLTSYGHSDIFLAKFNSNGQVQWVRHAGGPGPPPGFPPSPGAIYDAAWAIATDSTGNCYLTGICEPTAQFDIINANFTNNNRFVAKYNTQGIIQWVRAIPNEAYGIAIDKQGNYYLTGRFVTTTNNGIYCEKYNANGIVVWSKQSITPNFNYASSIGMDDFGNCYITGVAYDNVTFDNFTIIPPPNGSCMFLIKYTTAGSVQWGRQTNGGSTYGQHLATDRQGNIYVTGGMYGNIGFSGGSVQLIGANSIKPDVYAAKYSTSGNLEWALQAGSGGNDYGQAIGVAPSGDVFVSGSHQSTCAFGNVNLTGSQSNNYFIAKIAANSLGIAEKCAEENVLFYPNPASVMVSISAKAFSNGTISVFNNLGQEVYGRPLKQESTISVADWPAGIYTLKLTTGGITKTQKLVVTK